ncbi:DNA-3-methyladenine glycosylase 1 [Rubripirellula obstinata]|uniref:DNA-3-methyladenine glycosylase 1 n=1 Tax=Rubripirellula obstinata TaxID=406547 RepID=A0A5B1CKR2_9BACT|nr:DNA-3-methyladenine glycosylase I [Rubripirellula obstinata]KAA1260901.1 DNA-3-methyladenine glycosylase 1 [Rubripirellula obstinata]
MTSSESNNSIIVDDRGTSRCWWCGTEPIYVQYHDEEWGKPVHDDRLLFEKMCLEGFQAGLSWITILKKRESFREAFCNFDFHRVARFDQDDIDRLVTNAGIVRHRGKIKSAINNAQRTIEMTKDGKSLSDFYWQFKPDHHVGPQTKDDVAAITPESTAMSKALKKNGWTFVGPTTCYALMQSMGIVDDHLPECCYRSDKSV